eukprot:gene5643-9459_t
MSVSMQAVKPQTKEITRQESQVLVRNLIRTSISTICYLRNLFPDESFQQRSLVGIQINSLLPKSKEAQTLIDWMEKGVFDAINKKYLKKLIFGVSKDQKNDFKSMIESYEFIFEYPEDGVILKMDETKSRVAQTKEDIKLSIQAMIRTIVTLSQSLNNLPSTRYLSMKLMYYDEVTPEDYEPEYFRACNQQERESLNKEFLKISVTNVETKYHAFNLKIWTAEDEEEEEDSISNGKQVDDILLDEAPTTPKKSVKEIESQHDKSPMDSIEEETQMHQECPRIVKSAKKKIENSQLSNESSQSIEIRECQNPVQEIKIVDEISSKMNEVSLDQSNKKNEEKKIEAMEEEENDQNIESEDDDSTQITDEDEPTTQKDEKMTFEEKLYLRCLAQVLTQSHITKEELKQQFSFTEEKATEVIQRMIDDEFIKKRSIRKKHAVLKTVKTSEKLDEIMMLLPTITDTEEVETTEKIDDSKKRKFSALESSQDPYEFSNSKISTTFIEM